VLGSVPSSSGGAGGSGGGEAGSIPSVLVGTGGGELGTGVGCAGGMVGGSSDDGGVVPLARGESRSSLPFQSRKSSASLRLLPSPCSLCWWRGNFRRHYRGWCSGREAVMQWGR
jgi:hypothetical protein